MIRVSVMYPKGDDKTFDIEYYNTKHMDIVKRTMSPERVEVDQAVDGPYVAIGHVYFKDMETMAASMGSNTEAMEDVQNFTNITPVMQVSQIL